MKKILFLILTLVTLPVALRADPNDPVVFDWIKAQANIKTFSAEFKQTRHLKALTQPLTATGKLWFTAPDHFRWEIMKPAPTIATVVQDDLVVILPKLKRAEKYSLAAFRKSQWKDLIALLDTGFPRSREEFEQRFKIRDVVEVPGGKRLLLQPKSAQVQKILQEVSIDVRLPDLALLGTTMTFIDGSVLQNDFSNQEINPKIDASTYAPSLDGMQVTQPLAQ